MHLALSQWKHAIFSQQRHFNIVSTGPTRFVARGLSDTQASERMPPLERIHADITTAYTYRRLVEPNEMEEQATPSNNEAPCEDIKMILRNSLTSSWRNVGSHTEKQARVLLTRASCDYACDLL